MVRHPANSAIRLKMSFDSAPNLDPLQFGEGQYGYVIVPETIFVQCVGMVSNVLHKTSQ